VKCFFLKRVIPLLHVFLLVGLLLNVTFSVAQDSLDGLSEVSTLLLNDNNQVTDQLTPNDYCQNMHCVTITENLPDLYFIELHIWWGVLNGTGVFIDYGVINMGATHQSMTRIESNLTFYADDNDTAFGYIIQSPLLYPTKWYTGEILGGNYFFKLKEKPLMITARIDSNSSIPESNETNNNLTVSVLPGVIFTGRVYTIQDGNPKPYEGIVQLNQYDTESISDFGYRHYYSDPFGQYNVSLCPLDPLDTPMSYSIMAANLEQTFRMVQTTEPVAAGATSPLDFIVEGSPPIQPLKPIGRKSGLVNRTYSYMSGSLDPDGDMLSYKFKWGDGTYSDWLVPHDGGELIWAHHAWSEARQYKIEVLAKDPQGLISDWSETKYISVAKTKATIHDALMMLMEQLQGLFPWSYFF
jgi:hypothetical protein